MSTITSTSTLADVLAAHNNFAATTAQMANWVELTPLASGDASTLVGLFGADLTDFLADCAIATTNCTSSDYDNYSGWAIGVDWTVASASVDD